MKIITVPILTEEYKIIVAFGTDEELAKYLIKTKSVDNWTYDDLLNQCRKTRGCTWDRLSAKKCANVLITMSADLSLKGMLSTLPHEASHAMQFILSFIDASDPSDEIRAHGISSVMRHCVDYILRKRK